MLLEVRGLDVRYGRNHAVKSVHVDVGEREIVTILGANGAGKSSLLKAIVGLQNATGGSIVLDGVDVTRWSASQRVKSGLVLVPEGRQILVSLTVHENLLMGAYCRNDNEIDADCEGIYERFPNLAERKHLRAAVLSGGEQQMLAIGRAMLARPKVLMLDEPSLGLSPILVGELFVLIEELNRSGLAILLVEQNTHKALQTAHRGYVLELGSVVMRGTPEELKSEEKLEQAYLGET